MGKHTIAVSKKTRDMLKGLKVVERQAYGDVIERLVEVVMELEGLDDLGGVKERLWFRK